MFVILTVDGNPVIDPRCGAGCRCTLSAVSASEAFVLRDLYAPGCVVYDDELCAVVRRRAPAMVAASTFDFGDETPTDVRRSA